MGRDLPPGRSEQAGGRIVREASLPEPFLERHERHIKTFARLLKENLGASDEEVLIISDNGESGRRIAPMLNALYAEAAERMGLRTRIVTQSVRRRGDMAERNVINALDRLPPRSLILLNASGRLGNMDRLGLSYRTFCERRGHRFFSSSNWSLVEESMFGKVLQAFSADYHAISKEGKRLKEALDGARTVRVTTEAGSDFTIQKQGMVAINNDGFYLEPGRGGNMPAGEVYFPPLREGVDGVIVIDGSYRTKDASLIPQEPIRLDVRKGRIVSLNGTPEAKALERTLRWAESRAKYPGGIRRICELGIGLNPGAELIGCTILDEKVRGTVHVANGSNKWFGGSVAAIIHLDHVLRSPRLFIDDEEFPLPR